MTREEAVAILDGFKHNPLFNEQHFDALDMAISALSAEGELISRKSLLNKINAYVVGSQDKEFICKLIKEMPSVENKGEWLYDGDCYICNQCKSAFNWWADSQTSNFCPNCGARMKGGE